MNRIHYIALLIIGSLTLNGCQKDELHRLGVEDSVPLEQDRIAEDDLFEHDTNAKFQRRKLELENIDTPVKEVSDGDEEADDDDVTSN